MYRTHNARVGIYTYTYIFARIYHVLVLVLVLRVAYTLILYKTYVRPSESLVSSCEYVRKSNRVEPVEIDRDPVRRTRIAARTLARLLFRPSSRRVPTFAPAHSQLPHPRCALCSLFARNGTDRAAVSLSVRKGEPCYSRRFPQSSQFLI